MSPNPPSSHHQLRDLLDRARAHLPAGRDGDPHGLGAAVSRAEAALGARLGANHPQLLGSLRELADLLGKAGI